MTKPAAYKRPFACNGWRIESADDSFARPGNLEEIAAHAVAAIEGAEGSLYHRSRHAATYLVEIPDAAGGAIQLYIKTYNAPHGLGSLKQHLRGGRADNVLRMTRALRRAGFHTAPAIVKGVHHSSGRTMLVSARAEGRPLSELIPDFARGTAQASKLALLRGLGSEIARLHRSGFIHGDLTPYNVFVLQAEPPRFVLLDHDRTRVGFPLGRRRRQLRNLVQLGRFDLAGLSNADRLRVFRAYAADFDRVGYRATLRRVARMLARRRRKDAGREKWTRSK